MVRKKNWMVRKGGKDCSGVHSWCSKRRGQLEKDNEMSWWRWWHNWQWRSPNVLIQSIREREREREREVFTSSCYQQQCFANKRYHLPSAETESWRIRWESGRAMWRTQAKSSLSLFLPHFFVLLFFVARVVDETMWRRSQTDRHSGKRKLTSFHCLSILLLLLMLKVGGQIEA